MSSAVFLTTIITLSVFMFGSILSVILFIGVQLGGRIDRLDTRIDKLDDRLRHIEEEVVLLKAAG